MTRRPNIPGVRSGLSMALGANDPRLRRANTAQVPQTDARDLALRRLKGEEVAPTATLAELIAAHNKAVQALTEGT